MAELPPTFKLAEPPGAAPVLPHWSYATFGFLAFGSVGLVCAVILIFRRLTRSRAASEQGIRVRAWHEAETALGGLHPENPREAATGASLILRRYLAAIAKEPALFETHEETLARGNVLEFLPEVTRSSTAEAFGRLAKLKYAPDPGSSNPDEIITGVKSLIHSIHLGKPA